MSLHRVSPLNIADRWFLIAACAFGIATASVCIVVLSRLPVEPFGVNLTNLFGPALVLHVDLAFGAWFMAMTAGRWSDYAGSRAGILDPLLFASGVGCLIWAVGEGSGTIWFNDYLPIMDSPLFFLGIGMMLTGWTICAIRVVAKWWSDFRSGKVAVGDTVPIGSAFLGLAAMATFGWQLHHIALPLDQLEFAQLVWGPSHLLTVCVTVLAIEIWYAAACANRRSVAPGRMSVAVAGPAGLVALMIAILADDGGAGSAVYTWIMEWAGTVALFGGAWVLHGVVADRRPPGSEGRLMFVLSYFLFAIGSVMGYAIHDNGSIVPAHYHGVIGSVTVAFMWAVYERRLVVSSWVKIWPHIQLTVYSVGLITLIAGLLLSDLPRKSSIVESVDSVAQGVGLGLTVVGGGLAVAGGLWFAIAVIARFLPQFGTHIRTVIRRLAGDVG